MDHDRRFIARSTKVDRRSCYIWQVLSPSFDDDNPGTRSTTDVERESGVTEDKRGRRVIAEAE